MNSQVRNCIEWQILPRPLHFSPGVAKGLTDFNYSKSLQELGQYALDKSRLRVDLTYIEAV